MIFRTILSIYCLLSFSVFFGQENVNSISELDVTIKNSDLYESHKEALILEKKEKLQQSINPKDLYQLTLELAKEYYTYQSDSARFYVKQAFNLAQDIQDDIKLDESKILQAQIAAKSGSFSVAEDLLNSINLSDLNKELQLNYLRASSELLIYLLEYMQSEDTSQIRTKHIRIRDSLISILPVNSPEYAIAIGAKYIEESNFDQANYILKRNFKNVKNGTREFSMYTAILAYMYERMGNVEKQKYFLTLSAISDIKSVVKENHALRSLATILYEEGDYNRANLYIKKSLEDAHFYNSVLRNLQSAKILTIIDKAYEIEKKKKDEQLKKLLITLSILTIVLAISFYFIYKQMLKVAHSKRELNKTNAQLIELNKSLSLANDSERLINEKLQESNLVKEQYIRSFLEICTEYIHKLDSFKEIVQRKLKTGQTSEVLKFISDTKTEDKENKELYRNFDNAFLNVYPYFEKELNQLLRPEEHYILKKETLNQELRIYALIRLGITDNSQIATFLHYSLRTVYNYRSRVKQKAIHPELFEENICEIGVFNS